MPDDSFDAVVAGDGLKGMVTALYLAKYGGMKVGISEERHEVAAGLSTE